MHSNLPELLILPVLFIIINQRNVVASKYTSCYKKRNSRVHGKHSPILDPQFGFFRKAVQLLPGMYFHALHNKLNSLEFHNKIKKGEVH